MTIAGRAAEHDVGLRPVFCVIEHLHRSRAVADDAVAGRFTSGGVTLDARPRARLDRRRPPGRRGVAHRVEQVLLRARPRRGVRRHRRRPLSADVGAPRHVLDRAGPDGPRPERRRRAAAAELGVRVADVLTVRAGPGRPPTPVEPLLASITDQVAHLRSHLTPERNHRTLELYALFVTALALPSVDPTGELQELAWVGPAPQPARGRVAGRRSSRVLDALPPRGSAVVPRRAGERPPLRARRARRLRRPPPAGLPGRPPPAPSRRHHPGTVGRRPGGSHGPAPARRSAPRAARAALGRHRGS